MCLFQYIDQRQKGLLKETFGAYYIAGTHNLDIDVYSKTSLWVLRGYKGPLHGKRMYFDAYGQFLLTSCVYDVYPIYTKVSLERLDKILKNLDDGQKEYTLGVDENIIKVYFGFKPIEDLDMEDTNVAKKETKTKKKGAMKRRKYKISR